MRTAKHDYAAMYRDYMQTDMTLSEIARKYDIARSTLGSYADRHGWSKDALSPEELARLTQHPQARVALSGDYYDKTLAVVGTLLDKLGELAQQCDTPEDIQTCAYTLKLLQPTTATLDSHQVDMAKIKLAQLQYGGVSEDTQPVVILPDVDGDV